MKTYINNGLKSSSGQIVVEYVLLMVVAVFIAATLTSLMVNRNPSDPGFLIEKWDQIIRRIGSDDINDSTI